jgi:hypothetical protein
MAISLLQSATAIAPQCPASFAAQNGMPPYSYSVAANGAGGTINATTGAYVAPANFKSNPRVNVDTIFVNDAAGNTASAEILVGSPLLLFCDIIANSLCICRNRVYLWDQKLMQPDDYDLYVAISIARTKPFGNSNHFNGTNQQSEQFVSMQAVLDLDIISRGTAARDRKEEVVLALNSNYSKQQQSANSFYVGTIPTSFINLSEVDGAAIPYRFRISVQMQYAYSKNTPVEYYDTFSQPQVATND